ncbi:MAG: chemotaxis protein CheW [Rhodanobacter sp.]
MSAPVSALDQASQPWLSFQIGAQLFAAPLIAVSEVVRDGYVTPVPGAAADVLGVRHLRGRIVPVLDGCRRLDVPAVAADPSRARVVMLSLAGQLVGLRVGAVGELLFIGDEEIEPALPARASGVYDPVSGLCCRQDAVVKLLDVRRLCRFSGEDGDVA